MKTNLPKGLISFKEAVKLNQNFIKTRSKDLNKIVKKESGDLNREDAVSCWFSIEELKNYIAYVENEAPEANGLRVYFGAYSNDTKKQHKKDLSTVFFVPTKSRLKSIQKDGIEDTEEGGTDITELDGLNRGTMGHPPSATYPQ
jgi:hypothetical protein